MSNSTKITDYVGSGTHAARPATPPISSSALALYRETDTGILYVWTGAAWTPASGPVLIGQTVTSGSAASVTFSSISAAFTDLELRVSGRSNIAAANDDVLIQFNGDTAANYDYLTWAAFGSGSTNTLSTGQTSLHMGQIAGNTAAAGSMGTAIISILGYAQTTFHKEAMTQAGWVNSGTSVVSEANSGAWRSTAAINAIKVFNGSTWTDGTTISLYGRP